ncbi:MAG TPA: competence protein CoiA family protein [Ktedonobacteraceae bacterium]|nr:competence protein CoiA family protein [Ktedonobacteraceae bacterium]
MLVAYGPEGQLIVADEQPLELLQRWSQEQRLHCPNCRGLVHVRGGREKRIQLHFAHLKGECAWGTEGESVRHARGKSVLAGWLRELFPQSVVTLEERLPGPNRIADVFVKHATGERWAVEYQCAPLELEEWQMRHKAYREAGIIDLWVIGSNRREKQEAFLEGILLAFQELLFLDSLAQPPKIWLRWAVSMETVQAWQQEVSWLPSLEGWVGRLGLGATLVGKLAEVRLAPSARLIYPPRSALSGRTQLIHSLSSASAFDAEQLTAYLRPRVGEPALQVVFIPLMRGYQRDPELLKRYNYGRGRRDQPLTEQDRQRIQKLRAWLLRVNQQGFSLEKLRELNKELPFVGVYTSFVRYFEMVLTLV